MKLQEMQHRTSNENTSRFLNIKKMKQQAYHLSHLATKTKR